MLNKLSEKEQKLSNIKKNINKFSTKDEQVVIKSLKKDLYKLNEEMENLYMDISWYESVNRVNLFNAQKSSRLINESNIYIREGNFEKALIFIVLASIVDALDGRIARLIKGTSKFGAELDSLTDFVNFGVCPSIILYFWTLNNFGFF